MKDLLEKLINEGLTSRQIAKEIGHSQSHVLTLCKKYGLSISRKRHYNNFHSLIGDRFGKIVVINEGGRDSTGHSRWICQCECGKIWEVDATPLKSGQTKSCGCKKKQVKSDHPAWKGFGEMSSVIYTIAKRGAIARNLDFLVTPQYIWNLFLKQNRKCALTGIELKFPDKIDNKKSGTASLDRIDSSKGYIEGNVQWVHKKINIIKRELSEEEFINWCRLVVKHVDNK